MKKMKNNKDLRSVAILNELFGLLDCSLARYLVNARPWSRRPYLLLGAIARRMASEHEYYAGEIARLLHARRENVNSHTYPMEFTYYNDLSLEYLAPRLLDHQRRLTKVATAASADLADDYEVRRILGKLLTSLRKYGSLLMELLSPHRLAPPMWQKHRAVAKTVRSASVPKKEALAESQTAA